MRKFLWCVGWTCGEPVAAAAVDNGARREVGKERKCGPSAYYAHQMTCNAAGFCLPKRRHAGGKALLSVVSVWRVYSPSLLPTKIWMR